MTSLPQHHYGTEKHAIPDVIIEESICSSLSSKMTMALRLG